MKAVRLHKTGGPEVLQLDEVPMPAAGPGQVLVTAHSIGAGIPDQRVRTGRYPWMPPLAHHSRYRDERYRRSPRCRRDRTA